MRFCPLGFAHDTQVRNVGRNPPALRPPFALPLSPGVRLTALVPDADASIEVPVEHGPNGRGRPGARPSPLGARRGETTGIEILCNALHAVARCTHLKNLTDDVSVGLVDLAIDVRTSTVRAVDSQFAIAVAVPPAGVAAPGTSRHGVRDALPRLLTLDFGGEVDRRHQKL